MFHQMHLVSTGHLTESASGISQQTMPTNKYLFIQAQAEATVYRIALTKRKIIIGITMSNCSQQNYQQPHTRALQTCDWTSHKALSFPSYSCICELTEKKLTSRISHLQIFELSINNCSPFPMIEVLVQKLCRKRLKGHHFTSKGQYLYQNQKQKGNTKKISPIKNSDILGLNCPFQTPKTFLLHFTTPFSITPKS